MRRGDGLSHHYVSQLAHVEINTPTPQASLDFFTDVLGLQISHREGQSVWLRAWGEFFHHSLKLTDAPAAGLAHAAWRVDGPDDLEPAAQRLLQHGVDGEFIDGDVGHGKAFRFTMPGGHPLELVWEVERFVAPADQRSVYPDRPQKQVARNATVRRLDHCTVFTSRLLADRQVMTEALRFRHMDTTVTPDGEEIFSTVTSGAHNHDYALVAPPGYRGAGEMNHFCYLFEPGGNRLQLQTAGYWNYLPDWEPVVWQIAEGGNFAWQISQMPEPGTPAPSHAPPQFSLTETFGRA